MKDSLNHRVDAYDESFVLDNTLMLQWYPKRGAELASGSSMLELGLGHGFTTAFFAQHFKPYRVIDGAPEMIRRFRSRFDLPEVDIVESWFETFETDTRYDNICMGFVLEHVDDPGFILRHFRKFLQPGGSIFVAIPNSESLHRRFGHASGLLPDMELLSDADHEFGHQRYFNLRTLTRLCEDEGYRTVTAEGILLKPITTQQMQQLALSPEILGGLLTVGIDYPELCNAILLRLQPRAGA
ncbi:class I SAM-dependent methyltransferase [Accumulibacter sp.]|uniref:class I SAM-dependent methyltransferase n=1 Tax=Accumulibacter sp. TaxID=2053492 RepID=UPI0035B4C001